VIGHLGVEWFIGWLIVVLFHCHIVDPFGVGLLDVRFRYFGSFSGVRGKM